MTTQPWPEQLAELLHDPKAVRDELRTQAFQLLSAEIATLERAAQVLAAMQLDTAAQHVQGAVDACESAYVAVREQLAEPDVGPGPIPIESRKAGAA